MSRSSGHAPLVWFTTLAIAGAGMIAAAAWHLPSALTSGALGLTAGTLALAAGLLVSMLHLGRRSRALLAARGTGRSHLSGEIVLAGATLAVGLGMLAMYSQAQREPLARTAAGAIAVLFLLSIGRVYRLKGQRTWRGASILLPLTTGLVCGEVFLWAVGDAYASSYRNAILASTDGGATWSQEFVHTPGELDSVDFANASHGVAVGKYSGIVTYSAP